MLWRCRKFMSRWDWIREEKASEREKGNEEEKECSGSLPSPSLPPLHPFAALPGLQPLVLSLSSCCLFLSLACVGSEKLYLMCLLSECVLPSLLGLLWETCSAQLCPALPGLLWHCPKPAAQAGGCRAGDGHGWAESLLGWATFGLWHQQGHPEPPPQLWPLTAVPCPPSCRLFCLPSWSGGMWGEQM